MTVVLVIYAGSVIVLDCAEYAAQHSLRFNPKNIVNVIMLHLVVYLFYEECIKNLILSSIWYVLTLSIKSLWSRCIIYYVVKFSYASIIKYIIRNCWVFIEIKDLVSIWDKIIICWDYLVTYYSWHVVTVVEIYDETKKEVQKYVTDRDYTIVRDEIPETLNFKEQYAKSIPFGIFSFNTDNLHKVADKDKHWRWNPTAACYVYSNITYKKVSHAKILNEEKTAIEKETWTNVNAYCIINRVTQRMLCSVDYISPCLKADGSYKINPSDYGIKPCDRPNDINNIKVEKSVDSFFTKAKVETKSKVETKPQFEKVEVKEETKVEEVIKDVEPEWDQPKKVEPPRKSTPVLPKPKKLGRTKGEYFKKYESLFDNSEYVDTCVSKKGKFLVILEVDGSGIEGDADKTKEFLDDLTEKNKNIHSVECVVYEDREKSIHEMKDSDAVYYLIINTGVPSSNPNSLIDDHQHANGVYGRIKFSGAYEAIYDDYGDYKPVDSEDEDGPKVIDHYLERGVYDACVPDTPKNVSEDC